MIHATRIPFSRLNERRKELGMSYAALAQRSGVSQPTVKRMLQGQSASASYANVVAVADALGVSLELRDRDVDEVREEQARKKAQRVAKMVQGTSALEGQAVDGGTYNRLVDRSYHELLAGSRRRLWSP